MKDLYNAIRDALSEYGYIIPEYDTNKLPSELTTATVEVDSITTIQAGFDQFTAAVTINFYNENPNALTDTVEAFITLMDRDDRATDEERNLPENQSTLRLLDRSNITSIETEKDENNATSKITITMEIYFENK